MELELKVPRNKPPFLGIRFNNSFAAVHTNSDMIDQFKNHVFTMSVESAGGGLNIRLNIDRPMRIWHYNGVKFDRSKLLIFLAVPTKQWNFGHIIDVNGRDQIIKTIPKNEVFALKVGDLRILDEY